MTKHTYRTYDSICRYDNGLGRYLRDAITCEIPERIESASAQPALLLKVQAVKDELLTDLISLSSASGVYAHDTLERFLVEKDLYCIGTEVPVWNEKMSGFIDVLRFRQDGTIEIFDFKPNAHKEDPAKVASQLFHYREMLCERTGMPRDSVICRYGDQAHIYQIIF